MAKCALVLSLVLATALAGVPHDRRIDLDLEGRIVGGSDAPEGAYPYQVSIFFLDFHNCGGSIINSEWILTAAHCVKGYPKSLLSVLAGTNTLSSGGTTYKVLEAHYHTQYDPNNIKNDVAVLRVEPITFTDKVKPIVLDAEEVGSGETCILSGWGALGYPGASPDKLQHIELKSISAETCKEKQNYPVNRNEICTLTKTGEGACKGDSGGPLVRYDDGIVKQVGIVSWGIPCAHGIPDVFARVSSYITWIRENCNNCI